MQLVWLFSLSSGCRIFVVTYSSLGFLQRFLSCADPVRLSFLSRMNALTAEEFSGLISDQFLSLISQTEEFQLLWFLHLQLSSFRGIVLGLFPCLVNTFSPFDCGLKHGLFLSSSQIATNIGKECSQLGGSKLAQHS
jgi:hypothetical protein